jgi:hypothetical protein
MKYEKNSSTYIPGEFFLSIIIRYLSVVIAQQAFLKL